MHTSHSDILCESVGCLWGRGGVIAKITGTHGCRPETVGSSPRAGIYIYIWHGIVRAALRNVSPKTGHGPAAVRRLGKASTEAGLPLPSESLPIPIPIPRFRPFRLSSPPQSFTSPLPQTPASCLSLSSAPPTRPLPPSLALRPFPEGQGQSLRVGNSGHTGRPAASPWPSRRGDRLMRGGAHSGRPSGGGKTTTGLAGYGGNAVSGGGDGGQCGVVRAGRAEAESKRGGGLGGKAGR